ncbi:hypothetical protein GOV03_01560 [Candidatus Woesearchaeota archaeon]|nr:hypothetical protein [Candidatus Woesearchaeota archaeon]
MAKKDQMKKLVRDCLLVGVGVAAFAKERADKAVKNLVKKEKLSKAEGKKLVRAIYLEADKSRKKITSLVEKEVKKLMKKPKKAAKKTKKKLVKKKR